MLPLILTWHGVPHQLVFNLVGDHRIEGTLIVIKNRGTQSMRFSLPEAITMEDISKAWESQRKNWVTDHQDQDGNAFIAVRSIMLAGKGSILWFVHHADNVPNDVCLFSPFGKKAA